MQEIIQPIDRWLTDNQSVALATVVETWGSAPRGVGSKMGVSDSMSMTGSVSGGCVETAVINEAIDSLADHTPRLLNFGVSDDTAWEVGLTCGGRISVFVETLDQQWWTLAKQSVQTDQATTTVTILSGDHIGQKLILNMDAEILYQTPDFPADHCADIITTACQQYISQRLTVNDLDLMIDVQAPRPHLILIGGVHVSIPLDTIARQMGFRVSLIDPRRAFATPERFPDVKNIMHTYPNEALPELSIDSHTYIAVLTHDPKIDDKALITALPSNAAYIGVLSSGRTHQKRLERLREAGIDESLFEKIRTPIGIDIGAKTPEEIALCIMAEIIAVRNGVL
jgi:xanthine dehydrogenase accessory factor